jgi:DNA polymerase alpha subunit A
MIHTHSDQLSEARRIGQIVKKEVNAMYKKLEIEIDSIFQRMLLLKKKKYAAVVIQENKDGTIETSVQIKGLDLVRRDWCGLSHDICK